MSDCCGDNSGGKITINVEGMSCNHCKMSVEKALKTLDGVKNAEVNLEKAQVEVSFDSGTIKKEELEKAVKDAGYNVVA